MQKKTFFTLEQLKEIHAWFTQEQSLPETNRTLTQQAADCYLSAKPVKRWLFPHYDSICDEGRRLLEEGIKAGEIDALRLSVYIDMGLWIRANYNWELLPVHLKALYEKTNDKQIKEILDNYSYYLAKFKEARYDAQLVAGVQSLKTQELPQDLGAHDLAYYERYPEGE